MRFRNVAASGIALAAMLGATGCGHPSYDERMQYLDKVSQQGIDYRVKLYEQKTAPSKDACAIGYELLDQSPPRDGDLASSAKWLDRVEEAYIKSCMTGELKPKPDVDGVDAVTAVPVTAPPAAPSASASPAT
ncbi:hypothetical protein ACGFIR_30420 [Micromonospora sp. NPDC049051]|uniref:hypothetical protein n=1 Tax=Micromonospora sp. NPDC049051 TaxID=3364264 RepID=UPI00370FEAA7